jgi:hypothetical protein
VSEAYCWRVEVFTFIFRVEYHKKKDKKAVIKFIKDETVASNSDMYKSHTVHVPSGEPPGSLSRPPAKRKPGVVRPITQGKLLKAGGSDVSGSLLRRFFDSRICAEKETGDIETETYTTASSRRVCTCHSTASDYITFCCERKSTSACPSPCYCTSTATASAKAA